MSGNHAGLPTFSASKRVDNGKLVVSLSGDVLERIVPSNAPSKLDVTIFIASLSHLSTITAFERSPKGDLELSLDIGGQAADHVKGGSISFYSHEKPYTDYGEAWLNFVPA